MIMVQMLVCHLDLAGIAVSGVPFKQSLGFAEGSSNLFHGLLMARVIQKSKLKGGSLLAASFVKMRL